MGEVMCSGWPQKHSHDIAYDMQRMAGRNQRVSERFVESERAVCGYWVGDGCGKTEVRCQKHCMQIGIAPRLWPPGKNLNHHAVIEEAHRCRQACTELARVIGSNGTPGHRAEQKSPRCFSAATTLASSASDLPAEDL
jgi:hypothetical protein